MAEWAGVLGTLAGTLIGGGISFMSQRWSANRQKDAERRAVAGAFAAELEAYLELMGRRNHQSHAKGLAERIRNGSGEKLRGFLDRDSKPLEEFPLARSQLSNIGIIGDLCFDLVKFYSLIAGVQSTAISAERGKYDQATPDGLANIIEQESAMWEEALEMARELVPKLRKMAGL